MGCPLPRSGERRRARDHTPANWFRRPSPPCRDAALEVAPFEATRTPVTT
jgi:hypothetical protein